MATPATKPDPVTTLLGEIKSTLDKQSESVDKLEARQNEIEKHLKSPDYSGLRVDATPKDPKEEGRWGFKSLGHFVKAVHNAGIHKRPGEELIKGYEIAATLKAIQGMNEGVGSDGGFLVPPTFATTIFSRMYEDSQLLSRTDNYTVSGNSMVFPRSAESSRATGSRWGGVQAYWTPEGGSLTLSRPTFGRLTLNLHKLTCFAGVTQELLDDSSTAMEQFLTRAFSDEMNFMVSDAIVRGTGAGQPQGLLNAPCKVSVTKESGQDADTVVAANVVKMYARLFARNRQNAVWFINQNVIPQLYLMTLGIGTAGVTVYMPPGGLSGKPYATLLGLPVIEIEQAAGLGDEGDIILVDLSSYVTIAKGGPVAQSSMHFYFDTDQQAFRVTYRLDGQPWWHAPLTPFKGSETQSMVVTLAARA